MWYHRSDNLSPAVGQSTAKGEASELTCIVLLSPTQTTTSRQPRPLPVSNPDHSQSPTQTTTSLQPRPLPVSNPDHHQSPTQTTTSLQPRPPPVSNSDHYQSPTQTTTTSLQPRPLLVSNPDHYQSQTQTTTSLQPRPLLVSNTDHYQSQTQTKGGLGSRLLYYLQEPILTTNSSDYIPTAQLLSQANLSAVLMATLAFVMAPEVWSISRHTESTCACCCCTRDPPTSMIRS